MDPVPSKFKFSVFPLSRQQPPLPAPRNPCPRWACSEPQGPTCTDFFVNFIKGCPVLRSPRWVWSVGALEETGGGEGFMSLAASQV